MNDELISRSELKKVITANQYLLSAKNNSIDYGMFTTGIMQAIDNAPTVEYPFYQEAYQTGYEEGKNDRPQGEWIYKKPKDYVCSCCGYSDDNDVAPYCWHCGAKMKGGAE